MELAFLCVGEESTVLTAMEDFANLSNVIGEFGRFGEDDEIIEIGSHETIEKIKKIVKGVVHKVLVCSWSVRKSKVHD